MRADCHPNRHFVNAGKVKTISTKIAGAPIKYFGCVVLEDVNFVVHSSGVKRAQAEGVRNVHAYARGEVVETFAYQPDISSITDRMNRVTYYFEEGYFRDIDTNEKVTKADRVVLIGRDCFYV